MSEKEANLKDKLRQALTSTIRVISGDLEIKQNHKGYKNSNKFDFFEVDKLDSKIDFIKARAEADSSALKKKFSNNEVYKKNIQYLKIEIEIENSEQFVEEIKKII